MARKKKLEFTVREADEILILKAAKTMDLSTAEFCRMAALNKAHKVKK